MLVASLRGTARNLTAHFYHEVAVWRPWYHRTACALLTGGYTVQRQFHHPRCRQETPKQVEEGEQTSSHAIKHGTYTRRLFPHGRVVGKAGRRQRETFESLGIDSLGKRSEVVILRDVDNANPVSAASTTTSTLQEIGTGIGTDVDVEQDGQPNEKDVLASMEALRPLRVSLDKTELSDLVKQLAQSYNKSQLKAYLARNLPEPVLSTWPADGLQPARVSIWCRGTSSPSYKLPRHEKHSSKPSLSSLAKQIIRTVWGVSEHSELQEIGELEIVLSPSQYRFLAQRYEENQQWKSLFPVVLARTVELSFFESRNTIRIIARRHDALEATHVLADHINGITSIEMRLKPAQEHAEILPLEINAIQIQSGTLIEFEEPHIRITGLSAASCYSAKRMLAVWLSQEQSFEHQVRLETVLSYPNSKSLKTTSTSSTQSVNDIPMRDRRDADGGHTSCRATMLRKTGHDKQSNLNAAIGLSDRAIKDIKLAINHPPAVIPSVQSRMSHTRQLQSRWQAFVGYSEHSGGLEQEDEDTHLNFSSHIPALGSLLRHFIPISNAHPSQDVRDDPSAGSKGLGSSKLLMAELIPSQFCETDAQSSKRSRLPILRVFFEVTTRIQKHDTTWQLTHRKTLIEHTKRIITVKLPDREADVQLREAITTALDVSTSLYGSLGQDNSLESFIRVVQGANVRSLSELFSTLLPQHDIYIPGNIFGQGIYEDVTVVANERLPYICSRLSFHEQHDLSPKHHQTHVNEAGSIMSYWPADARLQLRQSSYSDRSTTDTELLVVDDGDQQQVVETVRATSSEINKTGTNTSERRRPDGGSAAAAAAASESESDAVDTVVRGALVVIDMCTALSRGVIHGRLAPDPTDIVSRPGRV